MVITINTEDNACTYSGADPNMSEVKSNDMTPKKNDIFSRVRTTFADCQAVESDAIRLETFITE